MLMFWLQSVQLIYQAVQPCFCNPRHSEAISPSSAESGNKVFKTCLHWVAVKELKLNYYIGETLLFTIYTHYGNLI